MVLGVDKDPFPDCIGLQRDLGAWACELEGVLQNVRQRCQEALAIA